MGEVHLIYSYSSLIFKMLEPPLLIVDLATRRPMRAASAITKVPLHFVIFIAIHHDSKNYII
jgi:hypothetical protein